MTQPNPGLAAASATVPLAGPDGVLPFAVEPLDLRGRAVQLGPMLDTILSRHDYPEPVSRLLAEAITLTVLLGTSLKFEGKFILQTQTDGPVPMLVADFRTPTSVRAYARFDEEKVAQAVAAGSTDTQSMLGEGILAMTIDQGRYMQRYQGIVKLDGISLEEVARQYFRQSEQIPTDVRLAVSETFTRGEDGATRHGWRAGGVLVQFLPESEDRMRLRDLPSGNEEADAAYDGEAREDDAWREAVALMQTVSDDELSDPTVEPERLLFRLFNEHGVRVFDSVTVRDDCSCSREGIARVLDNLDADELDEAAEGGRITVDCQFCSKHYAFDREELLARREGEGEERTLN